jgi:hypothetical protein
MRFRRRPSPAMGVAMCALVVALSGTAWAAVSLPAGSVDTRQLRDRAVKTAKLAPGAVTAPKLARGSVGGRALDEASVGKIAAAAAADTAQSAATADSAKLAIRATSADNAERAGVAARADSATVAGRLAGVAEVSSTVTANNNEITTATAQCPAGQRVTGGGYSFPALNADELVLESYPAGGTAWRVRVFDDPVIADGSPLTVYALCVAAG